jgi:hypothetical protein
MNLNAWSDQHVRNALAPLAKLAQAYRVAVLLVRHPTKNRDASALEAGAGSVGIIAGARAGFLVGRNPDDLDDIVFAPTKQNLVERVDSLSFRIRPAGLNSSAIEWQGISSLTADALRPSSREQVGKLEEAEALLNDFLANGEKSQTEVHAFMKKHAVSVATMRRARTRLQIDVRKKGFGTKGKWSWSLPASDSNQTDVNTLEGLNSLAPSTTKVFINSIQPSNGIEQDGSTDQ